MEPGISRGRQLKGAWLGVVLLLALGCPPADEPAPVARAGCADGQIDDDGVCVPEECGIGPWAWLDAEALDGTVHVAPDGRGDGDGSRAAPLDSVQAGFDLAVASGAARVALAAGTWEEALALSGGDLPIEMLGRCAALVDVHGGTDAPAATIARGEVTLAGLTLSGGAHGVDVIPSSSQPPLLVTLRDLRITDSETVGLMAFDASTVLTLERVSVDGIRDDGSGVFGVGVDLERGVEARVSDLRVLETAGVGLFLSDAGTLLTGEGIVLERSTGVGLQIQLDARVEAVGVHVSGARACDWGYGVGIQAVAGGQLVASELLVEETLLVGVVSEGPTSTVELQDSVIGRIHPTEGGLGGQGIALRGGALLVASDLVLEHNDQAGLVLTGEGTRGELTRVQVVDTGVGADTGPTQAVAVYNGSSLQATGLSVVGTWGTGLVVASEGTVVTLHESEVRATVPTGDGRDGHGVHVQEGASLLATGLLLEHNTGISLGAIHTDTTVELQDSEVRATRSDPEDHAGRGIAVATGAHLFASRVLVSDSRQLGVGFSGEGATGELVDCRVTGTVPASEPGGGNGLVVESGAAVLATGLEVVGNAAPGVVVQADGVLELHDALLEDNGFAGAVSLDGGQLTMIGGEVRSTRQSWDSGGGVGVFSWDVEQPSVVDVEGVVFEDLPGPGLYLRGAGSYRVVDSTFAHGGGPGVPGGVFAGEGVTRRSEADGAGLLVEGNSFSSLGGDALLLDASSATVADNGYEDVVGLDVYVQRCAEVLPPLVDGADAAEPWCQSVAWETAPLLEYAIYLYETGLEE
jgi:hypothetical protein